MVMEMLKEENDLKYKKITQQYGFINPNKGSNVVRDISPIRTHNFTCFFQYLKNNHYKVIICFSAPELTIFKTIIVSGFALNIKKISYVSMLQHEDNRIRGWSSRIRSRRVGDGRCRVGQPCGSC